MQSIITNECYESFVDALLLLFIYCYIIIIFKK